MSGWAAQAWSSPGPAEADLAGGQIASRKARYLVGTSSLSGGRGWLGDRAGPWERLPAPERVSGPEQEGEPD